MFNRITGVLKLDANTFEEVEHDLNATVQAGIIVVIVAICQGIANLYVTAFSQGNILLAFFGAVFWTIVGWILWSIISYVIGTWLFAGQATIGEMLRVIGFAYAPQVLALVPCIGGIVGILWSLVAAFIAVRQGLDLDNLRTIFTILIGFAVYFIGSFFVTLFLSGFSGIFR